MFDDPEVPDPIENAVNAIRRYLQNLAADGWVICAVEVNAVVKDPIESVIVSLTKEAV